MKLTFSTSCFFGLFLKRHFSPLCWNKLCQFQVVAELSSLPPSPLPPSLSSSSTRRCLLPAVLKVNPFVRLLLSSNGK